MTVRLTSDEQILAAATKDAVQAAGGLEVCARETGLSIGHLSRCGSRDNRDSITVRDAHKLDRITHGAPGHPHILTARTRILGYVLVPLPEGPGDAQGLMATTVDLTAELGDVANKVGAALSDDGICDLAEAIAIRDELNDLDRVSATLRIKVDAIIDGAKPAAAKPGGK